MWVYGELKLRVNSVPFICLCLMMWFACQSNITDSQSNTYESDDEISMDANPSQTLPPIMSPDDHHMMDDESILDSTNIQWPNVQYAPARLRRLTRLQFQNSIHALLGDEIIVPQLSEPDLAINGLFNVGASMSTFSDHGVENISSIALEVGQQALMYSPWADTWTACIETSANLNCFKTWLKDFALQVWRRPIEQAELNRHLDLIKQATEVLGDPREVFPFIIAAFLQSPHFLYRHEETIPHVVADPDLPSPQTNLDLNQDVIQNQELTPLALATRISFFLYNTTPSATLLQKALTGKFDSPLTLKAEIEQMLDTKQSRIGILNFFNEYLKLYALDSLKKDPTQFDHYYPEFGEDARAETLKLIEMIVFDLDQDFRTVLTTKESFINTRLAALYQIPAFQQDTFDQVQYTAQQPRGGLLTHASFLALHSHTIASSATLRGRAIRTLLLCQKMPEPPVDVDTSIPEPSGTTRTLRQRVQEHLENPSCAGCHTLMDPLGLALENFDAIGRWRTYDNGEMIDASGELDGMEFEGALALGILLADHEDFGKCLVKKLTRYAIGRLETSAEAPMIEALYQRLKLHQFRIKPWLVDLMTSPFFRYVGQPQDHDNAN